MSGHRTPPERRVDDLSVEARKLRAIPVPERSKEQRARLWSIEHDKLPAAWRLVNDMREGRR